MSSRDFRLSGRFKMLPKVERFRGRDAVSIRNRVPALDRACKRGLCRGQSLTDRQTGRRNIVVFLVLVLPVFNFSGDQTKHGFCFT